MKMMMKMMWLVNLSIVLCSMSTPTVYSRKPHNLTIMSLVQITGSLPKEGKTCMAAQKFVLDSINARNDILPDYHVIADFNDEGSGSNYAGKAAVNYARRMEALWSEQPNNPTTYQSPIMMGMSFTPGCKTFGTYIQLLNSVLVAGACLGSLYTANRKTFPNLYRTKMSAEMSNYGLTAFIKSNGWSKVGLYANVDNQYNTMIANHFLDVATKNDVEVIWFDNASGINVGVVQSMKRSGARIFVFQIAEVTVVYQFLCLAYVNDIRGPRYTFIFSSVAANDPTLLPDTVGEGCTKAMLLELYSNILMVGAATVPFQNSGNTTLLQYDLASFEALFPKYAGWKDKPAIDAEDRFGCHDRMLQVVLALDRTEKKLVAANMSLRDFHADPVRVMNAANQSVAESDFVGLRVGHIKYSKRLEIEDEDVYVTSRQPGRGFTLHINYRLTRNAGVSIENVSAYIQQTILKPLWPTANGLPPHDFVTLEVIDEMLSSWARWTITGVAISCAAVKFLLGIGVHFKAGHRPGHLADVAVKAIFLVGCITLDMAAIAFASNLRDYGLVLCLARPFLTAIGLAIVNGLCVFRLILLHRTMQEKRREMWEKFRLRQSGDDNHEVYINLGRMKTLHAPTRMTVIGATNANGRNSLKERNLLKKEAFELPKERLILLIIGVVGFILLNVSILIALAVADRPELKTFSMTSTPMFNEERDTLTEIYVTACSSSSQPQFFAGLAAVHSLLLITACVLSIRLRVANFAQPADKFYRICIVNITTLQAATVCIFFMIVNVINAQQIVLSVAAIVISATAAALVILSDAVKPPQHDSSQTPGADN